MYTSSSVFIHSKSNERRQQVRERDFQPKAWITFDHKHTFCVYIWINYRSALCGSRVYLPLTVAYSTAVLVFVRSVFMHISVQTHHNILSRRVKTKNFGRFFSVQSYFYTGFWNWRLTRWLRLKERTILTSNQLILSCFSYCVNIVIRYEYSFGLKERNKNNGNI